MGCSHLRNCVRSSCFAVAYRSLCLVKSVNAQIFSCALVTGTLEGVRRRLTGPPPTQTRSVLKITCVCVNTTDASAASTNHVFFPILSWHTEEVTKQVRRSRSLLGRSGHILPPKQSVWCGSAGVLSEQFEVDKGNEVVCTKTRLLK